MADQNYPALYAQLQTQTAEMFVVVNLAKQIVYGPASDVAVPGGGTVPTVAKRVELRIGQLLDGDPVSWSSIIDTPQYFPTTWEMVAGRPDGVGSISWTNVTDKPTSFPSSWSNVSGKPTSFPVAWADVSNTPENFPTAWGLVTEKPNLIVNQMTAPGDLIVGGAAGAPTRLAKGTVGHVLTVTAEGLAYAPSAGGSGPSFPVELNTDEAITLTTAHLNKFIGLAAGPAQTVTVTDSSSFPVGAELFLMQLGNLVTQIAPGGAETALVVEPGTVGGYFEPVEFKGPGSVVRLKKIQDGVWSVSGSVKSTGGSTPGPVAWADVTDKPTSFPSSWSEVSGKPTSFPSAWANVADKPTIFASNWANVADKPTSFASSWSEVSGKPATFAPTPPAITEDTTTARTLALTDAGKYLRMTNSAAINVTVPQQTSVAWAADTEIHIEQSSTGAVTIVAGAGVVVNKLAANSRVIAGQYGVVTLKRTDVNIWTLFGALGTA